MSFDITEFSYKTIKFTKMYKVLAAERKQRYKF